MKKIFTLIVAASFFFSLSAQDTFSICAIDTVTGEVGSAGATCWYIANQGAMIISYVSPGVGVIHAQAYYLPSNKAYAISLMNQGVPPADIIDSLVANDAQGNPTIRQYGIVDFRDGVVSSAGYTGENCDDYKNHIVGPNYAIQGNILLGQGILDSIEARFLAAEGELVCRLMEALQGANVPGADTRCLADGTSSIGAFLRVAKPDDSPSDLYFQVNLPSVEDGVDPIDSLQTIVDQWGGCDFTSIDEISQSTLNVYPNPAGESVYFEIRNVSERQSGKLHIYDTFGHLLYESENLAPGTIQIDISAYQAGVYLYRFENGNGNPYQGKFMKR